jgi:hypothetical protein
MNVNRTILLSGLAFLAGTIIAFWFDATAFAQFRSIETTSLLRTDLGSWCEGKELTVDLQEYGMDR